MITILSWNIQNGLGIDGKISLKRIADTILETCDADVICLQEVSVNCKLADGTLPNQVKEIANLFSDYQVFFGPAYDVLRDGYKSRQQYGNIILSRLPILSCFNHMLPQIAISGLRQMPRQLTEITVGSLLSPICIMTTHLEYHSKVQRCAQLKRILNIKEEIVNLNKLTPVFDDSGAYAEFKRSNKIVICGDFNFLPTSTEYNILTKGSKGLAPLIDAWKLAHTNLIHTPTCGIFDKKQWSDGPHCRDFAFISANLKNNVDNIFVNKKTNASDHQPIVLTFSGLEK